MHDHYFKQCEDCAEEAEQVLRAGEKLWAWMCSDWGDSDGEPFKQEAIDAWVAATT